MEIILHTEVQEFVSSLEKQAYAKTLKNICLLEKFGFNLGMPHSKNISKGLFELRVKGQQEVRIFYCFYNKQIHLLCGFIKKTRKTPQKELKRAIRKYKELSG
jgi:phage-related protein